MATIAAGLTADLIDVIGIDAVIALAEAFGGRRLCVPTKTRETGQIASVVGVEAARRLSARYAPDFIRVPLMRDERIVRFKQDGRSNGWIATKLVITETAVDKAVRRLRKQGRNL